MGQGGESADGRLDFRRKVLSLEALAEWRSRQRAAGRVVVVTNGCFDVLHLGHVTYLAAARGQGDVLLVGVNSDDSVRQLKGPGRPVNPEDDRAAILAALEFVDAVTIFPELTATRFLSAAQPDVYVKGGDYTIAELPREERQIVEQHGGRILLMPEVANRSSSSVVRRLRGE